MIVSLFWGMAFYPLGLGLMILSCMFCESGSAILFEWDLYNFSAISFKFVVLVDFMSVLFLGVVIFISANVLLFTSYYMNDDKFIIRFTYMVGFFVLSMGIFIFVPHMVALLLGWDGLGLTSFALVIYYQNAYSLGAGMITVLMNRVGDALLLLAIGVCLSQGHWMIYDLWLSSNFFVCGSIVVAAMTKSAQIPFSSWLPAAMAAPTPVSALVHSSTLVTAGVYLMVRFFSYLSANKEFLSFLVFLSSLTMLMASLSALVECDLKKIIALSTLSQLGLMMMSLGLGSVFFTFFHLVTHAIFKALLFLGAGLIIKSFMHSQDLRTVGYLSVFYPLTFSCIVVAVFALSGVPFLAGFYSKDLILEISMVSSFSYFLLVVSLFGVALTAGYSMRLFMAVGFSEKLAGSVFFDSEESKEYIWVPLMSLSVGAVVVGSSVFWGFVPYCFTESLTISMKYFPIFFMASGFLCGYSIRPYASSRESVGSFNSVFWGSMWFLNALTGQKLIASPVKSGGKVFQVMDQGWLEVMGPQGIFELFLKFVKGIQQVSFSPPTLWLGVGSFGVFPLFMMFLFSK